MNPLISVIIPVYNSSAYLPRCIDSLIAQTLPDIELIFVDDGSSDNSLEILRNYQNSYSSIYVHSQANQGPSAARNVGLCCATGKYIAFVDSDDWVSPQMYSILYELAEQYHADMVMCGYNEIRKGHRRERIPDIAFEYSNNADEIFHDVLLQMIENQSENIPRTVLMGTVFRSLYKKSIITNSNLLFDTKVSLMEDKLFNIKYISNIKSIAISKECLYNYELTNDSSTTRYYQNDLNNNIMAYNIMSDIIYEYFHNYHSYENAVNCLNVLRRHLGEACITNICKNANKKMMTEKLREIDEVINHQFFHDIYAQVNLHKFPYKQLITYTLLKYQNTIALFLLYRSVNIFRSMLLYFSK